MMELKGQVELFEKEKQLYFKRNECVIGLAAIGGKMKGDGDGSRHESRKRQKNAVRGDYIHLKGKGLLYFSLFLQ